MSPVCFFARKPAKPADPLPERSTDTATAPEAKFASAASTSRSRACKAASALPSSFASPRRQRTRASVEPAGRAFRVGRSDEIARQFEVLFKLYEIDAALLQHLALGVELEAMQRQ